MDDFTGAEIYQMWSERLRDQWQHTSQIVAMLHNANCSKKSDQKQPDEFNPMESGNRKTKGIPLNSKEGFEALAQVAKNWRR